MSPRRSPSPAVTSAASRRGRRWRMPLAALALAATAATAACGDDPRPVAVADAPRAEFLLVGGDSTYWVASGPRGVHVRAAPLFLARWDGRFYEVYTSDDDWSYPDAEFSAQRLWRRDLVSGDSALVLEDSTVVRLARDYAAAHPGAVPLAPDEEMDDRPVTSATTEIVLVDVHGPYLTVERRADVDVVGRPHRHDAGRTVVDLRTGRAATLGGLFGDSAAVSLARRGRAALRAARDSVRALAAVEPDSVRQRAESALPTLRFDDTSFGLADDDGRPAVAFAARGADDEGTAVLLPLPALPAPERAWWREVRRTLPRPTADSAEDVWNATDGLDVVARDGGDGRSAVLLRAREAARGARQARGREWALTRVAPPARQLFALDRPPIDSASRRALIRAFDESSLYGGEVVLVARRGDAAATVDARRSRRPHARRHAGAPNHPRTTE